MATMYGGDSGVGDYKWFWPSSDGKNKEQGYK